jgi:Fe-S cluster assembly protein SufB
MSSDAASLHSEYKWGFSTAVEKDSLPKGLNEEIVRQISKKKNEPSWMLDFRLKAFSLWQTMKEPHPPHLNIPKIDFQDLRYYSAPKQKVVKGSLNETDPELLKTFQKLGIPLEEQLRLANVAIDVVFDSVSIGTTFNKKLEEAGVILCSISDAIQKYPEIIQKYLATVVPPEDNFYAALNSAVFSDGSFVYIPKGVRCPVELSTYFRMNDKESGQFERTLIIAEESSYVSYLEGCTAPAYSTNQLHAAVVELIAHEKAEIKYSTVQNWYAGYPKTGKGGVYNFVTKRGLCQGDNSKISWTQVEAGASITWKYPSCILQGDNSIGEFYSVALTNGFMQADTGTKMIHKGKNTSSTIISKGIATDSSKNIFRSLVKIEKDASGARNFTQCDTLLSGNKAAMHAFPSLQVETKDAEVEHEASTSKLNEDQLFYLRSRGICFEDAINLLVNGFCKKVLNELPLEFAQEAKNLLALKLEHVMGSPR